MAHVDGEAEQVESGRDLELPAGSPEVVRVRAGANASALSFWPVSPYGQIATDSRNYFLWRRRVTPDGTSANMQI